MPAREPRTLRLVSTKHYESPELERFQLMIEDLLEKAHADGLNHWHRSDEGDMPVWIGAVWITDDQYETRFIPGSSIVEPARLRKHVRKGTLAENPVIQRPVTDFMDAAEELFRARAGDKGARPEVFFGSGNPHYPAILITLAPQQERIAGSTGKR